MSAPSATAPAAETSRSGKSEAGVTLKLSTDRVIGNGSFGVVFEAEFLETKETVAVKKVLQDRRFKNRELQIMKQLHHPNIVALRHYFYQNGEKEDEVYLNLVLEFVPDTVYKVARHYAKSKTIPPPVVVKLYVYQMCRSLAYLHSTGVCHRDIKPQNLLVDARSHVLKLCDFGSAKALTPGEPSVAYICSRYYRAPELIFGCTEYTTAIDVWSAGCVFGELILGHPLFPGETGVDQLIEIIKILGTPSKEQVDAMNPSYHDFHFPSVVKYPWAKLFKGRVGEDGIDLINKMLDYHPSKRLTAIQCCAHPFFDELRDPSTRLPDGGPLPALFNYSEDEMKAVPHELRAILIPPFARNASNWPGFVAGSGTSSSASASASTPSSAAVGGSGASAVSLSARAVAPSTSSSSALAGGGGATATAGAGASSTSAASSSSSSRHHGVGVSTAGTSTHSAATDSARDSRSTDAASLASPTAAAGGSGRGSVPSLKHYTSAATGSTATPRTSTMSTGGSASATGR